MRLRPRIGRPKAQGPWPASLPGRSVRPRRDTAVTSEFKSNAALPFLWIEDLMRAFPGARAARFWVAMVWALSGWAVHAQTVVKVTAIPDESPTGLMRKVAPLVRYLGNRGE